MASLSVRWPTPLEWFLLAMLAELYDERPFYLVTADGRVLHGVRL